MATGPLQGLRIVESSMLRPAEMGGLLADLGAEVIKVEPPQGDYGRQMTWPIVKSSSPARVEFSPFAPRQPRKAVSRCGLTASRRCNRVPRLGASCRCRDRGDAAWSTGKTGPYLCTRLRANPQVVFCSISGYGATGPYAEMPSHGVAYDYGPAKCR